MIGEEATEWINVYIKGVKGLLRAAVIKQAGCARECRPKSEY